MKRSHALAAVAVFALAMPALGSVELPQPVINALTPIDTTPTTQSLKDVFGDTQALGSLVAIVSDRSLDFGVQLRAIRALPQFCSATKCQPGDLARDTLLAVIADFTGQSSHTPIDVLRVRAAIEALGVATRIPGDVDLLVPYLDNPSRDIRATTAHALRAMCISQAIVPLRARYQHEQVAQVRLAISEALRDLGQPACM